MYGWRDEAYYKADPWRGSWKGEGGGVLVNQAPHQLDLLLWYMGPVSELFGYDFASRDLAMGSYNCLVDLIAHKDLGGKTLLYMIDFLYVAENQTTRVMKYESFGDQWCSSLFLSQDPVAIDSVGLDFIRNEPRADECRGKPENYLHEAALAEEAPSKTVYHPHAGGKPAVSLGVHEHWNNPIDKQYSRNLGKREGIELVAWPKGSKPKLVSKA